MKKKYILTAAVCLAIVAVVVTVIAIGNSNKKEAANTNMARRDGAQVSESEADEDLLLVDGSKSVNMSPKERAEGAVAIDAAASNLLGGTNISGNANKPISDDVQVVRRVLIPEAVTIGEGDIGSFYSREDFMDVIPVDIDSFSASDVPSKYDSRDVDGKRYVTAVEDQGYSYLCWAYAALGAVESDILKKHEDISYKDLDLSEKHLAYYNLHSAEGSVGGLIDSDYRELVNATDQAADWIFDYDTGYIACGGVTDYCISLLTAWKGPVDEINENAFTSMYGSSFIFTDNAKKPSPAYGGNYHVQSVLQMPGGYENNLLIKQMIMEHGAATIGVCAESRFWKDHNSSLYSSFGKESAKTADHEVLIIGWDDDYSASNFRVSPGKDGAWLCKNSWGSGSGDGGCFYLSYYDETVAVSNAAAYDVALNTDDDFYDNNYQAAAFFTNLVSTMEDTLNMARSYSTSTNPYGMLYTASSDEILKAVGFMSLDLYQQYELDVYLNPDMEGDRVILSDDESHVLTQKISAISGGFHTFELDRDLNLDEGDKFFVLIRPVTSGRLVFEEAEDMTGDANYDEWMNLTGNIHNNYSASGLSYYISDDGESMVQQIDKDFFVKAYTLNR
ncbi:MAG: hypothetical protein IJ695_07240 [Butyrivibrio sp.]|nr:hypothetical protein [Butyrivibrio sp.]